MARLENAIETLVKLFEEYSDCDGYIAKSDFKDMLDKEIANPEIKAEVTEEVVDNVLGALDRDKDGYFSIKEFTVCVGLMTRCLYNVENAS
ncbi:protein S100-B-like [Notolabrus celidotus]|uniref:protein S100-B-like n=1 Tax=Notolabrus celidotus TaxID=1203425 RepID=UPI0014903524|nr:protein S100-B-like [Notolabrus celidotus]